mgnify:CR=1 FL=1
MKDNCVPITIKCGCCETIFDTLLVVKDGVPYDRCCSMTCYNEYYSLVNTRDRKIKNIIDNE